MKNEKVDISEYRIVKVHSIHDVSESIENKTGKKPKEPHFEVDLTYDCYGEIERKTILFSDLAWNIAKLKGSFMMQYL